MGVAPRRGYSLAVHASYRVVVERGPRRHGAGRTTAGALGAHVHAPRTITKREMCTRCVTLTDERDGAQS